MTESPREVYALCLILAVISNYIWSVARVSLEFKAVFCSVLFLMVLTFAYLFIKLEKLKVKN